MIKSKFDHKSILESKGLWPSFENLSSKFKEANFKCGKLRWATTKLEAEEVAKNHGLALNLIFGITKGVTKMVTTGLSLVTSGINFILPSNLFWDNIFCVMATARSFVTFCDDSA